MYINPYTGNGGGEVKYAPSVFFAKNRIVGLSNGMRQLFL